MAADLHECRIVPMSVGLWHGDYAKLLCMNAAALPLNADQVAALAHPLRARLHGRLRTVGPATSTVLARELSTNSGATSYHLRALAAVGLVRDAAEPGRGRERRWEATAARHTVLSAPDGNGDEDLAATLDWLDRDYLRHFLAKVEGWLDAAPGWPAPWRESLGLSDHVVVVTAEQAAAMTAELAEVIERHRRVGQGNPRARRVAVYLTTYPVDLDRPPLGDPTGAAPGHG
jgi:DNA-binding transcriptional ArsR family regulator